MGFLKNVMEEMRQTTWPTNSEVNRYTITVISAVILFVVYFALADYGIDKLFSTFVR